VSVADIGSAKSGDIDDQAAMLRGWDQSYTQLEAGKFEAEVQLAQLTGDCGIFALAKT
jgi:hypothetical protein